MINQTNDKFSFCSIFLLITFITSVFLAIFLFNNSTYIAFFFIFIMLLSLVLLSFLISNVLYKILHKSFILSYINSIITTLFSSFFVILLILVFNGYFFTLYLNIIILFSPLILLFINSSIVIYISSNLKDSENVIIIYKVLKPLFSLTLVLLVLLLAFFIFIATFIYTPPASTSTIIVNNKTYLVKETSYNWMHPDDLTTSYSKVIIPHILLKESNPF